MYLALYKNQLQWTMNKVESCLCECRPAAITEVGSKAWEYSKHNGLSSVIMTVFKVRSCLGFIELVLWLSWVSICLLSPPLTLPRTLCWCCRIIMWHSDRWWCYFSLITYKYGTLKEKYLVIYNPAFFIH